MAPDHSILADFSPLARSWFTNSFDAPTPAQAAAWGAIAARENALVIAPTGSGKTLAAFLWSLDRLASTPPPPRKERLRVLYVSPLKALAVDVERNLRAPLTGMRAAAQSTGVPVPDIEVGVRTGDTPQEKRRRLATQPPDILITTPESLFLLLTSAAREALRFIDTVIIDEVHAVAATKRGAHLALSLERLDALLDEPAQRIGLSATVRPPQEVARFLGGERRVRIVAPPSEKRFDLRVTVPLQDMSRPEDEPVRVSADEDASEDDLDARLRSGPVGGPEARTSVWPHMDVELLDVIRAHRSTIIFVNSRRLAERLCSRLNELAGEEVVRAHHGSVARDQRLVIEEDLKAGRLPAVVATSSLELGIDMGAVDLVVQVGAPDSVASGLQRIGRAGHSVGAVSRGIFFPKFKGDLLETAVVVERVASGAIEETHYPRNPLDVLAQQIVAMVAMDEWKVDDLEKLVRRSACFADLPRDALESVLDMLSGRYPSDEFAELRPRLNWDRIEGTVTGRSNAQRLAVTSGGTIPDRGLFGVFIAGDKGSRVGELDEEMVYESRPGEVFVLGASSWRIEEITHDRVLVTPAPGLPGKMPFWHGDAPGRPLELGRAVGAFTRELVEMSPVDRATRLETAGLDKNAATNLIDFLEEQREATSVLPDDRTIVLERFRDELGDWRVCIHTPFGARVHAPWAQAIEARLRERIGVEAQSMYSDDGIIVRLPEAHEAPPSELMLFDAEEVEELVVAEVGSSALFASRFRECAARSLLLPKRRPGGRTPLWQQRQKSYNLLQVAARFGSFPVILETFRECLQDVFDLPALEELMGAIARREIRVVEVETAIPSPFAVSLQFGYVSSFMYEGDAPLAERRAQALSLDRSLLAELMGRDELRELIDPDALTSLELELQMLTEERHIQTLDGLHDALRSIGDLSESEIGARVVSDTAWRDWLQELSLARRVMTLRIAGEDRWVAVEDAPRFRDALGTPLPMGLPDAFLEPVADPIGDLVERFARTHGPFDAADVAARLGLGVAVIEGALRELEARGRVAEGEFRPGASGIEWIDTEVLRKLRRRSLVAYRKEIEPAPPEALARFYLAWHGIGPPGLRTATSDSVYEAIEQLEGFPVPASALETHILPARLTAYSPSLLDELGALGEVVWTGAGAIGSDDGWICLTLAGHLDRLPDAQPVELSPQAERVRAALESGGAMFFRQISDAVSSTDDASLLLSVWELVWAGHVTNDTLAPLRALIGHTSTSSTRPGRRRRGPSFPKRTGPGAGAGRWSLVRRPQIETTRRLHRTAEQLLARHGIVTRGAIGPERITGGFAAVYPVLKAMEEAGRVRRGYFVDGLGGMQFALPGAVDRMRGFVDLAPSELQTHVISATDPANPYGAALPWPDRDGGHRAGRKSGAVVVLVGGRLVIYVERGGRTLLSYTDDDALLQPAVDALALAAREGILGKLHVERADGEAVQDTAFGDALMEAGFRATSRGLRLRA
jgi:ATP-dependent Lhr-like helicase